MTTDPESLALLREIQASQRLILSTLLQLPDTIVAALSEAKVRAKPQPDDIARLVRAAIGTFGNQAFTTAALLGECKHVPELSDALQAVAGDERPGRSTALGIAMRATKDAAGVPGGIGFLPVGTRGGVTEWKAIGGLARSPTKSPFGDSGTSQRPKGRGKSGPCTTD